MQYNKTRKLMIIDGRDCAGFLYDMSTGEYEWFMYDRGYTAIPKDNIISVSKKMQGVRILHAGELGNRDIDKKAKDSYPCKKYNRSML